jgi:hypothetical protein
MRLVSVEKVVDSPRRGGMIVMECGAAFVGRNGMPKMFDTLQIVFYEVVRAQSDFYARRDTDIVRPVAKKP